VTSDMGTGGAGTVRRGSGNKVRGSPQRARRAYSSRP
jgi:hypothetical protein